MFLLLLSLVIISSVFSYSELGYKYLNECLNDCMTFVHYNFNDDDSLCLSICKGGDRMTFQNSIWYHPYSKKKPMDDLFPCKIYGDIGPYFCNIYYWKNKDHGVFINGNY